MGLTVKGVECSLGAAFHLALEMDFESGLTVLFGRSGCGKTSALRLISGLLVPEAGYIKLDDTVFFDAERKINRPVFERRVGFVFQHPSLFPHMDVESNVAYGARKPEKVPALLEQFHLTALRRRYPRDLSGGETQRVTLARSLASHPRALLLDEPFSALDERRRMQFHSDLIRLKEQNPIPVVLVTHNLNEAFALADRLIIMDEGRIVESYDALSLFSRPRKRVTAELLGVENLLPCRIERVQDSRMIARLDAFDLMVDADPRFRAGDRAWVGIRAVDVRLIVTDTPKENEVTATIHRIIPSVASNKILLRAEGGTNDYDLIMDLDEHHCTQHMIRPGGRIRVTLKRSKAFLCE